MNGVLPANEWRCRPSACDKKDRCLRHTAPIPATGGSVGDGTYRMIWGWCVHFVPLSGLAADKVERRVHPPIGE